jgi:hypothetical protein
MLRAEHVEGEHNVAEEEEVVEQQQQEEEQQYEGLHKHFPIF